MNEQPEDAVPASLVKMAMAATAPAPGYGNENNPPDTSDFVWRENLNTHLICKDCKETPPNLVQDNASTICASCGLVLSDREVSYESEWRTFNSDENRGDDPNRVGEAENELLNNQQMSTTIASGGPNASKAIRALQRTQAAQTSDKANKALMAAYKQIDDWGNVADLSGNVRQTAKTYYKQVEDSKGFKGKSLEAILAGCIFIACRQCNTPRTFSEVFGLTQVPKKEIGRVYKQLEKFLTNTSNERIGAVEADGGTVNYQAMQYVGTTSTTPAELCARYCNMLGLNMRVENVSYALAKKVPSIETLAGRSPLSTAAACIYFASQLLGAGRPSKKIAEVASVSDATVKHAYKLLLAEKDRLIEASWLGEQPLLRRTVAEMSEKPLFGDVNNLPSS